MHIGISHQLSDCFLDLLLSGRSGQLNAARLHPCLCGFPVLHIHVHTAWSIVANKHCGEANRWRTSTFDSFTKPYDSCVTKLIAIEKHSSAIGVVVFRYLNHDGKSTNGFA